jgi:hypothetical protein
MDPNIVPATVDSESQGALICVRNDSTPADQIFTSGQKQPVHDEKYFFADGDCIFLAEGILFKVKRLSMTPFLHLA